MGCGGFDCRSFGFSGAKRPKWHRDLLENVEDFCKNLPNECIQKALKFHLNGISDGHIFVSERYKSLKFLLRYLLLKLARRLKCLVEY